MTTEASADEQAGASGQPGGGAGTSARPARGHGAEIDRLAALEDERRFLLRSLADLDREHDAGDVDDSDYETLKDGYTTRAAVVLRNIEAGRSGLAVMLSAWQKPTFTP